MINTFVILDLGKDCKIEILVNHKPEATEKELQNLALIRLFNKITNKIDSI